MRAASAVRSTWSRIGLRWRLVILNGAVIVVAGLTIMTVMHGIAAPQFMDLMHQAGDPPNPDAGQRAYDAAVQRQVYPTIAIAAAIALVLNFVVVTLALRPLRAVQDATRRLAAGDVGARVETRRRDEIGNVAQSVDELARSLERLEDLRRQVTNDVAHELRTPIHNVLGIIEAMRDGVIPASADQLDRARGEVQRLIALVEDLRALSNAQLARDRMEHRPVRLVPLLGDVLESFAPAMAERGLTSQLNAVDRDVVVMGDADRLAQVARNVVANAVRYARTATSIAVRVTLRDQHTVRVEVTDFGEAISPEALPYIFERFFRADPSRARQSGGAGIGLAIVRELVSAHGGSVGASSEREQVSVWFDLPVDHDGVAERLTHRPVSALRPSP